MAGEQFKRFIDLVAYDQEANKTGHILEKLQAEVAALVRSLTVHEEKRARTKFALDERTKEVHARELVMREHDEQEQAKKKRLEDAADDREYKSLKTEIAHLKKAQHDGEQALMTAWNAVEAARTEFEEKDAIFQKEQATCNEKKAVLEAEITRLRQVLTDHERERNDLVRGIPEAWLEKYAVMRQSVTNPVVPLEQGSCSACFYHVTSQDLQQLCRNVMLQCHDCYRFLYRPDMLAAGTATATV